MIRPPGFRGAAFGTAADGDGRHDPGARQRVSQELGIPAEWAWVHQVHGCRVWAVDRPGRQGDGDALFTTVPRLPLAVGVADCYPVVLEGPGGVGLAHMGWRGAAAGVVGALREAMEAAGVPPLRAAVGPGIGPCCYEVGADVLARLAPFRSRSRRGGESVDLAGAAVAGLDGLEVWQSGACTCCGTGFHSYRRDAGRERQVAVAWLA